MSLARQKILIGCSKIGMGDRSLAVEGKDSHNFYVAASEICIDVNTRNLTVVCIKSQPDPLLPLLSV
jgi:hypothetical protein